MNKAIRFLGVLLALAVLVGALTVQGYAAPDCCGHEMCDDEEWCEYYCDGECDDCCEGCEDESWYYYDDDDEDEAPKSFWDYVWDFITFLFEEITFSFKNNMKLEWDLWGIFPMWFNTEFGFKFNGVDLGKLLERIFG